MIDFGLLWFIGILVVMNISAVVYTMYTLTYSFKGLQFLEYAYDALRKHDENKEAELISTRDAPLFAGTILAIKNLLFFIMLSTLVNFMVGLFAFFPLLMLTGAWTIMIWMAAISNAFVIVSILPFPKIKHTINAICESYNVLIQSFEHVKEYEETNNDSSE